MIITTSQREAHSPRHPLGVPAFPKDAARRGEDSGERAKRQALLTSVNYQASFLWAPLLPGPGDFFCCLSQAESGFLFLATETILTGTLGMPVTALIGAVVQGVWRQVGKLGITAWALQGILEP